MLTYNVMHITQLSYISYNLSEDSLNVAKSEQIYLGLRSSRLREVSCFEYYITPKNIATGIGLIPIQIPELV